MKDFEYKTINQLYDTCAQVGFKIFSDDECCRCLAWLYIYGGGNEEVLSGSIYQTICYAQRRLNLIGGEMPNAELLTVLQGYIKSIADYKNPPEWVLQFEKKHKLRASR